MIPKIITPFGDIPTFSLMAALGMLILIAGILLQLRSSASPIAESNYILPKVVVSALSGLFFAGIFDAIAKFPENHALIFTGISFYGGLIGAVLAMYLQIRLSKNETEFCLIEWFNILTEPVIAFHICGRIGCFLGGCCFGQATKSILGVPFPDIPQNGIIHNGEKCLPTQLFEVTLLLLILILIFHRKNKFVTYLITYAIGRFVIEFFRGDHRGASLYGLSPAQLISIIILLLCSMQAITAHHRKRNKRKKVFLP